jgi:hypothetical protein
MDTYLRLCRPFLFLQESDEKDPESCGEYSSEEGGNKPREHAFR